MLVNTHLFREQAIKFEKTGRYCDFPQRTPSWYKFWERELDRCKNGYSVGGVRVTGHHYFYLNYVRFLKFVGRGKPKEEGFPDFWDGDYRFFHLFEKARSEGKHLIVGKARRKGYSQKDAAIAANTYNTVRKSTVILGAHDAKYLYPDGIMTMAVNNLDFLNEHTAWSKRRSEIDQIKHVKASYKIKVSGRWLTKGYKSQIMALTFQDNPDAARGKNANVVILDECGAFDNLKRTLASTRPCVEAGGIATGIMVLFGTGGDMEGGTIDFESIFYSPEEHGFLAVPNEWDESADGMCGYFHPTFLNKEGFMDKDGNSKIEEAKAAEEAAREHIKRTSKDPTTYDKYVTEYPFNPKEAFLRTGSNMFPVVEISEWRNRIESSKTLSKLGSHGFMHRDSHGIPIFKVSADARPILKYPHDKTGDLTGCVTVWQSPYQVNGKVPDNLYYIKHDPYAGDTEGGHSLGAAYVKKRVNNFSKPDDMIVAAYVGRPLFQDDYNYQLFLLAEYYNAKITFESDRGEVVPYARRHKLLHWLEEEFELFDKSANFKLKRLGRNYGTSMGSKERKRQAEIYWKDWLLTKRGISETGEVKLNLHTIYDVALLDEMIRYDPNDRHKNFDRVSACLVGTFTEKALYNKEPANSSNKIEYPFFERELF